MYALTILSVIQSEIVMHDFLVGFDNNYLKSSFYHDF